jgi:hypothetical protein
MNLRVFSLCLLLLTPVHAFADAAPNVVTEWAAIVQQSIHNAGAPRSAGSAQVLHAMIMLAMYDAAVSVEGGYEPFAARIRAPQGTDVRAAIATAAYQTARARVASSQVAFLDQQYATYLSQLADGPAKADGIDVGQRAAAAMLALRSNDNFNTIVLYECSAVPPPPGEFEPDAGCPSGPASPQPVDAKVGRITPFTFANPDRYRPTGPQSLLSPGYIADFAEARDYGRKDSVLRSAEQTDVAYFWSENPYVHWNRNIMQLAISQGLDILETARLFAMVHTSAADAVIAGFEAKYHYAAWRPRTAIPRADTDGNPATDGDPTWLPLLSVNHPEYPSGHGFWSTAVIEATATFFHSRKVVWTITTSKVAVPLLVQAERTYTRLDDLLDEIGNARIWAGLHWRHAIEDGAKVGRKVATHVTSHFFRRAK